MKNIILFSIIMIMSCQMALSQNREILLSEIKNKELQEGDYIIDPNIDKFVGLWEWGSNGEVFQLELKKIEKVKGRKYYMDMIEGRHTYTKNNQIVENSFSSSTETTFNSTISQNDNSIDITFKKAIGRMTLEFIKRGELLIKRSQTETIYVFSENSPSERENIRINIPLEIILTKKYEN